MSKIEIEYINLKKDINFNPIDLVLNNLGSYYKIIKKQYEIQLNGGNGDSSSDSSEPKKGKEKKYYKKYKNLIKSSAQSISYYKNLAQMQISNYMGLVNYYQNLAGALKSQRDKIATGYQILGNDIKNDRQRIDMLETMITGLEKFVESKKDFDVSIKKITLKGGAMGYEQFNDSLMQSMGELTGYIDKIDEDKNFIEKKITNLQERMKTIVEQNEKLFTIKAEIEWMVNQMENGDGKGNVEEKDFTELYSKVTGMINDAKSKGSISTDIAKYIGQLEEYSSYLENYIKANNKTLGSIKIDKKAILAPVVESKKKEEEPIGTKISGLTATTPTSEPVVPKPVILTPDASTGGVVTSTSTSGDASSTAINPLVPSTSTSGNATLTSTSGNATSTSSSGNTSTSTSGNATSTSSSGNTSTSTSGNATLTKPEDATASKQEDAKTPKSPTQTKQGNKPGNKPGNNSGKKATESKKGGSIKELIGGGSLLDEYRKQSQTMIEKIKKVIDNDFANVEVQGKEFILELLDDKTFVASNDFSVFFGKIATMFGLVTKLDEMVNDYNKLFLFLSNNPDVLKHNESTNNMVELWKDVFKAKNTDFYSEQLLKYSIYFYNYNSPNDLSITVEDALKNLVKQDEQSKIVIKIESVNSLKTEKEIDDILNNIDNSIIAIDHIIFFIENMVLTFMRSTVDKIDKNTEPDKVKEYTSSIQSLESRVLDRRDKLTKSSFLTTKSVYSILYGQTGGSNDLVLPSAPLDFINKEQKDIYLELFRLLSSSIIVPSDKNPVTESNQKQVDRTIQLTNMMTALYEKINNKLGKKDDKTMFAGLTDEQKQIKKFSDFEKLITKLDDETKPEIVTEVKEGETKVSEITKPRLDIYRNRLVSCRDQLKPFIVNLAVLRNLLFETKSGTFSIDETQVLIKLYNQVKRQIEDGINSYIKLIPMIFFTIEFPPSVYAKDSCKYRFTFDTKNELVEYKFMDGQTKDGIANKETCNNLGLGNFEEKEFVNATFSSHAGFFESNKLNGTKKLIDDPVIGLGKLIKTDDSANKPINTAINMMFALGASGTGKTTRYFGKSNGHPDDKEGIVPYIINKSLEESGGTGNGAEKGPSKKISIAYFVSYGQKTKIDNIDSLFNELVIFFDINAINKAKFDSTVTEDQKYIPFYMPSGTLVKDEDVNKYTKFYSTVVSKKLDRRTFGELKNFISEGGQFPSLKPNPESQQKTFREILDGQDIWKEIEFCKSASMGELFEELIIEQKKINTVLPTKNNIESSRGHTCVLVKMEDLNATTNKVKYFPLFDMAGTENTAQIDVFLKQGRNTKNMAKLVQKVNSITQGYDILRADDESKQYPSLNDLLKFDKINNWVSSPATKNKYITIQSGGVKQKIKVDDFYEKNLNDQSAGPGESYLNKVVKEGYYINHTISMLIFAAMCVGSSLRTELVVTDNSREDKFDDFFNSLFTEIDKFTCIPGATGDADCIGKTMMMLPNKKPSAIVNSSCIWLQILFSFLYWNEETPGSVKNWLDNIYPETKEALTYLCEEEFQKSEIIPNIMTVEQLYKLGQVNVTNNGLDKLYDFMIKVNKTHQYTSANAKVLANPVSLVTHANGKLKIEFEKPGPNVSKNYDSTTLTLTIDNPDYEAEKDKSYKRAKELRLKLGLTEAQAKKVYDVPTDPGEFTTAKPGITAKSAEKNLWESKNKAHNAMKEAFNNYNSILSDKERTEYAKIAKAVEYNVKEKISIEAKVFLDYLETDAKMTKLVEFKTYLDETINLISTNYPNDFDRLKTQEKEIKVRNKPTANPEYKNDLIEKLDGIITKLKDGKFFYVPPKPTIPKGKPQSQPTSTTQTEKVLPLTESIKYDNTERVSGISGYVSILDRKKIKLSDLNNMSADIDSILQMFENKKEKDLQERKGFILMEKVIEKLENPSNDDIPQAELSAITKLLEVTGSKLKIDSETNKFIIAKQLDPNTLIESIPIGEVIDVVNRFPKNLPVCPSTNSEINKVKAENQMHRIRDGRAAATKMTLMHLVTGQGVKHFMVGETIKLCKTLYESTNLDLSV